MIRILKKTPAVQENRGFTLVETLVAITVLLIAIVGPLYAVHRSVMASYAARDQLVATALAQEGVEYVRYVRDSNYLESFPGSTNDWLDGLESCFNANGCTINPNQDNPSLAIDPCGAGVNGCPALRQDQNAAAGVPKLYLQTTNSAYTPTRFSRKAVITEVRPDNEVVVTVTVSWTTLRIPYSLTVTERLYNWL